MRRYGYCFKRIVHECVVQTENSVPRVTVLQSRDLPGDAERLSRGRIFTLHQHPANRVFFLRTFWYNTALDLNKNWFNTKILAFVRVSFYLSKTFHPSRRWRNRNWRHKVSRSWRNHLYNNVLHDVLYNPIYRMQAKVFLFYRPAQNNAKYFQYGLFTQNRKLYHCENVWPEVVVQCLGDILQLSWRK